MPRKHFDFVVVGSGVAGNLLALQLLDRGYQLLLFDDPNVSGSSDLAAGMINPITGRHFVRSWKIDTLLEYASLLYGRIEKAYDIRLMYSLKVIKALRNNSMINEWSARELDETYTPYLCPDSVENSCKNVRKDQAGLACIQGAGRVDFPVLKEITKSVLTASDSFIPARFDFSLLRKNGQRSSYRDIEFDHIVFCEGSAARLNPLWSWLKWVPAKGERLIIHAPDLQMDHVYNDGKIIIPLGEDKYWVGSNYEWDELDTQPTKKVYLELKAFLDRTLTVPYTIIDHAAHIRPSTYNRRPFVGRHPEYHNYYILNGLGAKGASLAPYCVEQLMNHILYDELLDEEIDVKRVRGKAPGTRDQAPG